MIKFPEIVLFDDSVFLDAITTFDSDTFKLFMYLYYRTQLDLHNALYRSDAYLYSTEQDLIDITGLETDPLYNSFLTLRRADYLTGLTLSQNQYDKPQPLQYAWCMRLNYDNHATEHDIEDEYQINTLRKHCTYLIIGKEAKLSLEAWRKTQCIIPKHLNTKYWKTIRAKVLERDGHKCTECGSTEKLHVHHLTYENEGNEQLEDLITACQSCHAKMPKRSSKGGGV